MPGQMTRVAVLDDYQRRARDYADWSELGPGIDVAFFYEPIPHNDLPSVLGEFEVLVLMRERTRFERSMCSPNCLVCNCS